MIRKCVTRGAPVLNPEAKADKAQAVLAACGVLATPSPAPSTSFSDVDDGDDECLSVSASSAEPFSSFSAIPIPGVNSRAVPQRRDHCSGTDGPFASTE